MIRTQIVARFDIPQEVADLLGAALTAIAAADRGPTQTPQDQVLILDNPDGSKIELYLAGWVHTAPPPKD